MSIILTPELEADAKKRGNPKDLPFEVLRIVVKKHKGNECTTCGNTNMVERGSSVYSLNTVARVRGNVDSYENLEVYCRKHNPENDG